MPASDVQALTVAHRLRPRGPHDTARLLAFVGAHAVPGVETWDGARWASSVALPRGPALVEVDVPRGRLVDVRLHLADPRDDDVALQRLRHLLDLDADVSPAEVALGADPLTGPLVARRPGLRVPGVLDAFETAVRTVVGQQVSLAGARTVCGRLVRAVGTPLPEPLQGKVPGVTHLFPSPQQLSLLSPDDDALAMPRARARAVVGIAEAFVRAADDAGLRARGRRAAVPTPVVMPAREELLAVPGVGPWTVDYLDLRVRRDPDVLLATDLAVRRAVERLGADGSPRAVAALAERWRPYRTTALIHLWAHYLDL